MMEPKIICKLDGVDDVEGVAAVSIFTQGIRSGLLCFKKFCLRAVIFSEKHFTVISAFPKN